MLTLSPSQLKAIAQPGVERLLVETVHHLRVYYPQAVEAWSDQELLSRLRVLMEETDLIPLNQDEPVKAYLIICLVHRVTYARLCQHAKISAILNDPTFSETEKMYLTTYWLTRV